MARTSPASPATPQTSVNNTASQEARTDRLRSRLGALCETTALRLAPFLRRIRGASMRAIAPALLLLGAITSLVVSLVQSDLPASTLAVNLVLDTVKEGTPFALLAIGASLILATGGVDLSSASVAALAGTAFALVTHAIPGSHWGVGLGAIAAIGVGCLSGRLVAQAVLHRRSPLIFTWALSVIWYTLARVAGAVSGSPESISISVPEDWVLPGFWNAGGMGFHGSYFLLFGVLALLHFSNIPRQAAAIGANVRSATYAGVNIQHVLTLAYTASGILSALAGVLWSVADSHASTTGYAGRELTGIAVAVLGGTVMSGGYLFLPTVAAAGFFWAVAKRAVFTIPTYHFGSYQQNLVDVVFAICFLAILLLFGKRLSGTTFVVHVGFEREGKSNAHIV